MYCLGADAVGLLNTQEAFRATAAREMHARGDWILPTLRGEPYLAKPPMIYWAQLALARLRGAEPAVLDLRLTTALAGLLGVLGTYLLARRLTRDTGADPATAVDAARWSALALAIGILYVRSARMGELDILIVPFILLAIGALHAAWSAASAHARTHWPAIALAALGAAGAALTKGPVPLAVIAVAIGGAILLEAAREHGSRRGAIAGAAVGAASAGLLASRNFTALPDVLGVAAFAACGAMLGAVLGACATPRAARMAAARLWRCHLELVLAAGLLSIWGWSAAVRARIGADAVAAAAARELEDNLRMLVPESPINNMEFLAYGMLPAGALAAGAGVWAIRQRPRGTRAGLLLCAWILGGFVLFSVAGKGVARYLTPLWPAIAMVGGMWLTLVVRPSLRIAGRWAAARTACIAIAIACALAQAGWYALARPVLMRERSPQDLAEAMRNAMGITPERVALWDIQGLEFEYHFGAPIRRWDQKSAEQMLAWMRAAEGPLWLLAQHETDRVVRHRGSVRALLSDAGFDWTVADPAVAGRWTHAPASTTVELLEIKPRDPVPGGR